ncbi:hypothetical protein DFJ43DRAFT_989204, partial [Lentinula guzmanii]
EKCLIDFVELIGNHSGENMAKTVWSMLEQYGLIISFVMDNATNNDTMKTSIGTRCSAQGIAFDAQKAWGRCLPHSIHLAAVKVHL